MAVSLAMTIVEAINIAVTVLFLILFSYRYYYLRGFSATDKYEKYYPKMRILFSVLYVILSVALLSYNLAVFTYQVSLWYEYIFQGGGGQCLDSIILLIQLGVLRYELKKEQPYTKFHLLYFFYLFAIEIVRFIFTLLNLVNQLSGVANMVLSSLLVLDSTFQLGYWIAKKQSLPQFQEPIAIQIDDLRHHSHHTQLITNRFIEKSQKSFWKTNDDGFPYIIPSVSVEHGKIKIMLQTSSLSKVQLEETSEQKKHSNALSINKISFDRELKNNTMEVISSNVYGFQQLKRLYISCGRFPIKKELNFEIQSLQIMAKQVEQYLQQLFKEKRYYQSAILKSLKVPNQKIKLYEEFLEQNNDNINNDSSFDNTLGTKIFDDKNSIYFSIHIYKHLWVTDYYEFYIKVVLKSNKKVVYLAKRYSKFEEHFIVLKNLIKLYNRPIELPELPKKHLFHWNQDEQTTNRRQDLEVYLKRLSNDYTLMAIPELRQKILQFLDFHEFDVNPFFEMDFFLNLKIIKGQITKSMIKTEIVTFYEFKIFKNGIQIKTLSKRFRDLLQLHSQLERWMKNTQITYKFLTLPQKHLYKSEPNRHDKLRNYLQNLVEIKDIGKVYAVNDFFNVSGNEESDSKSQISAIRGESMIKKSPTRFIKAVSNNIQLNESIPARHSSSEESSRRFSQIINDLGNENYD